jgi:hypothetical protein
MSLMTVGKSDRENHTNYKLSQGKYQNEIANLIQQINKYPQEESNYIFDLLLFKNDAIDKVLETAQKLEKAIPTSECASEFIQVSYKMKVQKR